jgi:hypothetical protein
MVIFNSYVKLPEGNLHQPGQNHRPSGPLDVWPWLETKFQDLMAVIFPWKKKCAFEKWEVLFRQF